MPGAYAFSLSSIPVALTGLLTLAFGARVLSRRITSISVPFFTITVVVAIWMAAFTGMYSAVEGRVALGWSRAAYFGVPFIPPALYWFAIEVLHLERRRRLAHMAAWIIAAFFSGIAVTTDLLIPRVQEYAWGFYPRYDNQEWTPRNYDGEYDGYIPLRRALAPMRRWLRSPCPPRA